MDSALLVARLLLAGVFAIAGTAKLADAGGSRKAVRDFGLPERYAAPLGTLLPLAELAVAIALIVRVSARWGALGALVLLLVFVAGIGVNLRQGRKPDCHCFGQLHSSPAGWDTFARNGVLAGIAAFIVLRGWNDPGLSAVAWLGDLSTAERVGVVLGLAGLGLLAVLAWAVFHLLGQSGRMLLRLDALDERLGTVTAQPMLGAAAPHPTPAAALREPGLAVGTRAPDFSLSGLHGETLTLGALRAAGKPALLVFTDPNCGPCNALLPDIGRWQRDHVDKLTVALISRGKPEAYRAKSAEFGLSNVLLQQDFEVAEMYEANGTPSAVIVRAGGTIASAVAAGPDAIRALVESAVGVSGPDAAPPPVNPASPPVGSPRSANERVEPIAPALPSATRIGDPVPALRFPDLDGSSVSLADVSGHSTVVLFWNPGCGYCTQMLDDLVAWEANPPSDAHKLLVISSGDASTLRAMGLKSTVLLDQGFVAGTAFGANGTPMAVLLGADGRVASPLVSGSDDVLALLNGRVPPAAAPALNGASAPAVPKMGDRAPSVTLPDLNGKMVDLAASRGTRTLVLFWNPRCGFCMRMLDDLKAWEAKRPKGAPKLLVVSTGDIEENRAMGLRSPILLDQGFAVGNAFGASGTPSAVLVDAKGNIATEVAVGAQAVLTLAGVRPQQEHPTSP